MNRLHAELQRLYGSATAGTAAPVGGEISLAGPDGRGRAMVLELARPHGWEVLARVWQGVQSDLELPAPAIAVSGNDRYQLWFSLAEPVPLGEAVEFADALRQRYLPEVDAGRIGIRPQRASAPGERQPVQAPPFEAAPGQWSAFLAPDLAALFSEERWLDLPPSADAQADLLARLASMAMDDWRRACLRLQAPAADASPRQMPAVPAGEENLDPRSFLLQVMNDRSAPLHLRIEAAKALLPQFDAQRALAAR